MLTIKFKKLNEAAKVPTTGSEYAAGHDLYACINESISINPQETVLIPTGLAIELPLNTVGMIYARSGLASKRGLAPANKVGVVDCDYRGEVMVALHNHSTEIQTIDPQERIAQLVVMPYYTCVFEETDTLSETVRDQGGFGSSGQK